MTKAAPVRAIASSSRYNPVQPARPVARLLSLSDSTAATHSRQENSGTTTPDDNQVWIGDNCEEFVSAVSDPAGPSGTESVSSSTVLPGGHNNNAFIQHASDFVMNTPIMISNHNHHEHVDDSRKMKYLEKYTVLGAVMDSSARDPPPRCHPETRVAVRERLLQWALNPNVREKSFIWLKGPAGVGKTAIMQSVAESLFLDPLKSTIGASFFFWRSDAERSDPHRLFTTIAYQLYTRYAPYRDYLLSVLKLDPKLPERAMKTQFLHFVVKPFVNANLNCNSQRVIILIDGLDECKGEREQCEIIQLIASFVADHPTAPLLWILSSRPESHIEDKFWLPKILPTYMMEEIEIDSEESWADVKHYLQSEFAEIRLKHRLSLSTPWPSEDHLLTVISAAGGLFAFASTVIRFIEDVDYRDPVTRLEQVLDGMKHEKEIQDITGRKRNPFVNLDSLYSFIMSTVPEDILPITNQLLGIILEPLSDLSIHFFSAINLLQIPAPQAHSALHKLNSVLHFDDSYMHEIRHKSFADYLKDESRSGQYFIDCEEVDKNYELVIHRILREMIDDEEQFKVDKIKIMYPDEEAGSKSWNQFEMLARSLDYLTMRRCCDPPYEILAVTNSFFPVLRQFIHAFNFVNVLNMSEVPPEFRIDFISVASLLTYELQLSRDQNIKILDILYIDQIDVEKIDISTPSIASIASKVSGDGIYYDISYEDMTLQQQTWYDTVESKRHASGYFHPEPGPEDAMDISYFLTFLKKKQENMEDIERYWLLGSGFIRCLCLRKCLKIRNRSGIVHEWSLGIPYMSNH